MAILATHGVDIHFLFYGFYADVTGARQVAELLKVMHDLPPTHQALGFGMLSMLRSTIGRQASLASAASALWSAVQLFNDFLILTPDEQATVKGSIAILQSSADVSGR